MQVIFPAFVALITATTSIIAFENFSSKRFIEHSKRLKKCQTKSGNTEGRCVQRHHCTGYVEESFGKIPEEMMILVQMLLDAELCDSGRVPGLTYCCPLLYGPLSNPSIYVKLVEDMLESNMAKSEERNSRPKKTTDPGVLHILKYEPQGSTSSVGQTTILVHPDTPGDSIEEFNRLVRLVKKLEGLLGPKNPPQDQKSDNNTDTDHRPNLPGTCGIRQYGLINKIVGGHDAAKHSWPWIASLGQKDPSGAFSHFCGGALITHRQVLTAAHCFGHVQKLDNIAVRLGEHDLNEEEDSAQDFQVDKVIKHEDYNTPSVYRNDIAMITLQRQVVFSDKVSPICLPSLIQGWEKNKELPEASKVSVAGWGRTLRLIGDDLIPEDPSVLQEVVLQVQDIDVCRKVYWEHARNIELDDKTELCAGSQAGTNEHKDSCEGDSGGPLVWVSGTTRFLVGLVSHSADGTCGLEGKPSIYASVPKYMDWILKRLTEESQLTDVGSDLEFIVHGSGTPFAAFPVMPECGFSPGMKNKRVSGGTIEPHSLPWLAAILYKVRWKEDLEVGCIGTVITRRHVLTSAHCHSRSRVPHAVRLAVHKIDEVQGTIPSVDIPVLATIPHENYTSSYRRVLASHDIAVLVLKRNIDFSDTIAPICLPYQDELKADKDLAWRSAWVSGWTTTTSNGTWQDPYSSMGPEEFNVAIVPPSKCKELVLSGSGIKSSVIRALDDSDEILFCALPADGEDGNNGNSCGLISGSPLEFESQEQDKIIHYMAGFITAGVGGFCGRKDLPDFYMRVAPYLPWIEEKVAMTSFDDPSIKLPKRP